MVKSPYKITFYNVKIDRYINQKFDTFEDMRDKFDRCANCIYIKDLKMYRYIARHGYMELR